jgi:ribonuclease HI
MQLVKHITHMTPGTDGPWYYLFFDGSCWPNPGGAMGVAWGIRHTAGPDLLSLRGSSPTSPPSLAQSNFGDWHCFVSDTLGPGTNNQAEYEALLGGLRHAHRLGIRRLVVVGDSLLAVKQVGGYWKTKGHLTPLMEEARRLLQTFAKWSIRHVSRDMNQEVDDLSRRGPHMKGPGGLGGENPLGRLYTTQQAAFIQWAYRTKRLTGAELARVFHAEPSQLRKCAIGETYGNIGVNHL